MKQSISFNYLISRQRFNDDRTEHSRQCSKTIGYAHQNTGIARSDIQMIDVESCLNAINNVIKANSQRQYKKMTDPLINTWNYHLHSRND